MPGPQLHAKVGDRVQIVLHNELPQPTVIHFHGLYVPNAMDGVPVITQPAVMPGESFTYEFTLRNAGSHMYHSHFMADEQVPMGLLGAFIVTDPQADEPKVDLDYAMILNDGPLGFTLNGKGFPATEPISVKQGDLIRVRYMNEGLQIHPMHLHGMRQQVIALDGYPLPQPVLPGHRPGGSGAAGRRPHRGHRARRVGIPLPHPHPRRRARTGCSAWSPPSSSRSDDRGRGRRSPPLCGEPLSHLVVRRRTIEPAGRGWPGRSGPLAAGSARSVAGCARGHAPTPGRPAPAGRATAPSLVTFGKAAYVDLGPLRGARRRLAGRDELAGVASLAPLFPVFSGILWRGATSSASPAGTRRPAG